MSTTDPFTEAASAAAEKQWTRRVDPGTPLSGPERMNRRIGFRMGAEWARTHLAAQEPTDAEVEAAARAWAASSPTSTGGFDAMSTHRQELLTARMRAALAAARNAGRAEG